MTEPPNRFELEHCVDGYIATEIRSGRAVGRRVFATLGALLDHARLYAGIVAPAPALRSAARAAGLLVLR